MSPFPVQMRDRWANRAEPAAGTGSIYWHVLLGADPEAQAAAADVRDALRGFPGLHLTPPEWLHMTLFIAGSTHAIDSNRLATTAANVEEALAASPPIDVSLGRILYHPEAIMLAVEPAAPLREVRERVRLASTLALSDLRVSPSEDWIPHMTIAYSTAGQPAEPIIDGLGTEIPARHFTIDRLSLVAQWGPERSWRWEVQVTIPLRGD